MISALVHLGYGFLRASVTYPFRIGRGKARFLSQYESEGAWVVSPELRALSPAFERCLGCGFCELALGEPRALRELALSSWRSPETWPALLGQLEELNAADLTKAEASCPGEIPLAQLVAQLRAVLGRWLQRPVAPTRAAT